LFSQVEFSGLVLDASTHNPVAYSEIRVVDSTIGASCDSNGVFTIQLQPGLYTFQITSLGFKSKLLTVRVGDNYFTPLLIQLLPDILTLSEDIVIYGEKDDSNLFNKNSAKWLNSTDDVLEMADEVNMISRGNFALEPTIRGAGNGQVAMVIDGMKIFSACIDKMDPVSAYIEVENLQKLEVSKGAFDLTQAQGSGGAINFITHKPDFEKKLFFEAEAGYESISNLKRIRSVFNLADSSLALRATFSAKTSADYSAGGDRIILNSGYNKYNYKIDFIKKFGPKHRFHASYIGDEAWKVGYPVLLMDATFAKSGIFSFNYRWDKIGRVFNYLSTTIYYNRIDHWMDDYTRDVSSRPVMPNMYMPMFGKTRTTGIFFENRLTLEKQLINLKLDYYHLLAFADMKMESIFPDVSPSYMMNLADVGLSNIAAIVDYHWYINRAISLRANLRLDHSARDVYNKFGKRQLSAFWHKRSSERNYLTYNMSTTLEFQSADHQTMSLSLARGERMPSHMENYGYFLYNIMDGYFYTGNPELNTEKTYQVELGLRNQYTFLTYQIKLYYNLINHYISGIIQADDFKLYANIERAIIMGASSNILFNLTPFLDISLALSYVHGQNMTFKEPLPLIPPLNGNLLIAFQNGGLWLSTGARFANRQNRVAFLTTLEDKTDAYVDWFLRGKYQISTNIELKFGVENIFNLFYHSHLSINNLPAKGRNLYLGLNMKIYNE